MKNKTYIPESEQDLGMCFHRGLRKGCDSKTSSLVYKLISSDVFTDQWEDFYTSAFKRIKENKRSTSNIISCLKDAIEDSGIGTQARIDRLTYREAIDQKNMITSKDSIFKLGLECLTDEDWNGLAYYFGNPY